MAAASPSARFAARLKARARAERQAGRFGAAALLLEEALRVRPDDARLRIQAGHMRKEARDLPEAEAHYLKALERLPGDTDLALQLGHFYKIDGRLDEAETQYRRAAELSPEWEEPKRELAGLNRQGNPDEPRAEVPATIRLIDPALLKERLRLRGDIEGIERSAKSGQLAPQLAQRDFDDLLHDNSEVVDVRRLGRKESSYWGLRRTLRGVEAVRGFCISASPIVELQILLNGLAIHRGPVKGPYLLKYERHKDRVHKYVFNVWLDFGRLARGLHALEVRLTDTEGLTRSFHDHVVIAEPLAESDYPDSDALVSVSVADKRSVDEQIKSRASMVRPAQRRLAADAVRTVLVMRTDQLGDMVASIAAVRRLRELLPSARFVALLTAANADFARSLGFFDEIIVIDFPDDRIERRRLMPLDEQEALREKLAAYKFDMAIDLAQASVSRELLRLSGAPFLYGVGGGDWPWLSAEFGFNTHDRVNGLDTVPHAHKTLALVETLGAILKDSFQVMRRSDLNWDRLAPFGIADGERYAVLHMGARVEFSRWPGYIELARMVLDRTDFKVVIMTEDPVIRPTVPPALMESDRFQLLDQRLTFDDFDALVSFASVLVGNDSGPKHLASLRGTPVVTLHTARINWNEWGQEHVGTIISRRVPCAGCAIFHDAEECGQDFTCIAGIRAEEVFGAVMRLIEKPAAREQTHVPG